MTEADPTHTLLSLLRPIAERVAAGRPEKRSDPAAAAALAAELERAFPWDGEVVGAIQQAVRRGVAEGWLCNRGEEAARFSRVSKAVPETFDLSIDVVSLSGAALAHSHPQGEVTMAFAGDDSGEAGAEAGRFDGHPPGWVVMPAGSSHTPTVTGPRMFLLYFLPGGAVQWHAS